MQHNNHTSKHYMHLAVMAILSFIAMYILMYAMVDRFANIYPNINQFYMAGLMTAPMVIIELMVMKAMYMNQRLNAVIIVVTIIAGFAFFAAIRQQTFVSDEQFLKSMIPHHSGAILMCDKSPLQDQEILALCNKIKTSQQEEIYQMKNILNRIQNK